MRQESRLARVFFFAVLASIGSAWGVSPANADSIALFTGSWRMESGSVDPGPSGQDQSVIGLVGPLDSTFFGFFSYSPLISNFSEQGSGCNPLAMPCMVTWSGVFTGGTVTFGACCGQADVNDCSFTGLITGGSFDGELICAFEECGGQNRATISFISTSTATGFANPPSLAQDVWSSQGTWSGSNCVGLCGSTVFGTLSMTTSTVPEPGTLMLLGAGIAAFIVRKRSIT
jgi:hypothetical protein